MEWTNVITKNTLNEIREMDLDPDCSYAVFVRNKLPHVWEKYLSKVQSLVEIDCLKEGNAKI